MKNILKTFMVMLAFLLFVAGCGEEIVPASNEEKLKEAEEWLKENVEQNISSDYNLPVSYPGSEIVITWTCDDEECLEDNKVIYSSSKESAKYSYVLKLGENTLEGEITINYLKSSNFDDINEKIDEMFSESIEENVQLPTTIDGASIEWLSSSEETFSSEGVVTRPRVDEVVTLFYTITIDSLSKDFEKEITVKGLTTPHDICFEWFASQIKDILVSDIVNLRYENYEYPTAVITWSSSDETIVSNNGEVHRSLSEGHVEINIKVEIEGVIKEFVKTVVVREMTIYEVLSEAMAEFEENLLKNENVRVETGTTEEKRYLKQYPVVSGDIDLPLRYEKYNVDIKWSSNEENTISSTGKYNKPCIDTIVELKATVNDGTRDLSQTYNVCVSGESYNDKWKTVETLLDLIHKSEITNKSFVMSGFNGDVANKNYGYLPFYTNTKTNREAYFVSDQYNGHTKPGALMPKVSWITIHDTANVKADALGHANYIMGGPSEVSWHFTVDDNHICQHIPTNEQAWHAGVGFGNREAIGIETCISEVNGHVVDYNMVMRNVAKLCGELLIEYNLTIDRVHQHYWFSGKNCPALIRATGRWMEMLDLIKIEYMAQKELSDATFVWTSLNPEIMDNTGKVINHPGTETTIAYKVEVTIGGETKTYTFESKLLPLSWS